VVAGRDVAAASRVLTGLGFTPLGELGIPLRWAFKEPERLDGTNTYVVVEGSLSLRNHLAVRDILRADAGLRAQYAAVVLSGVGLLASSQACQLCAGCSYQFLVGVRVAGQAPAAVGCLGQ
jgi:hypothetical protein